MRKKAAFTMAVVLALELAACAGGPPSAAEVYADAGKKMAELTSYHVVEEVRLEDEVRPSRLEFDLVPPDRFQASSTFDEEGESLEVKWIAVGDKWYIKMPPSEDYFAMPDEEIPSYPRYLEFMAALATQISDLTCLGEETVQKTSTYHLRGSLPPDALELIEPEIQHTESVTVELWVGVEDSLVHRYRFTQEGVATTLTLSRFDEAISIEAPANPRPADELSGNLVVGLRCAVSSHYLRDRFALPDKRGCVVLRVSGSAQRTGLRQGDLMIAMNGVPITSGPQFSTLLGAYRGIDFCLTVLRPGVSDPLEFQVTPGPGSESAKEDPNDPFFYYLRARWDSDRTTVENDIADYTRAIQLAPDFDVAYMYRGQLWYEMGDFEAARRDYARAIELSPDLGDAYQLMAWVLRDQGDRQSAMLSIQQAIVLHECDGGFIQQNVDCATDYLFLAGLHAFNNNNAAIAAAEKSIEFYAGFPGPYYQLAWLHHTLGEEDTAREYAAKYLEFPSSQRTPEETGVMTDLVSPQ